MASSALYQRLARHFVARLCRDRVIDAIERAIDRGVLERVNQTNGASLFRGGSKVAGWALARVRLLIRHTFGSHSTSSHAAGGRAAPSPDLSAPGKDDETTLDSADWLVPFQDDVRGKAHKAPRPGAARKPRREAAAATAGDLRADITSKAAAIADARSKSGVRRAKARRTRQRLDRMTLLRLVREQATPPAATQVGTLLMLADAVARSGHSLLDVLAILRRPKPIVAITGTVPGFEAAFLKLLRCGLVLPGSSGFVSGYDLSSINEYRRSDVTARRLVLFRGKESSEDDRQAPRQVSLAVQNDYPILAIADDPQRMPEALVDAADLKLVCQPLTPGLIAQVMQVVLGDTATISEDIGDRSIDLDGCELLSIADLGLAIRPGMSAERCLALLRVLIGRARTTQSSDASSASTGKASSSASPANGRRARIGSGSTIIEPDLIGVDGAPGDEVVASGKALLLVETLAGYGEARDWALSLKADLEFWKRGLDWSDMSTRLLLAGPPGTGKTTYARAFANTLQLKLLATSVATWLEPSHLGDVLARMSAAFAEAQAHAPCILFIDEIDGIGRRRDGSRDHDDYWNSVVNRALELIDGAVKAQGVIIVGATNHPEVIDKALLRSGRLETRIDIPLPDVDALVAILRHHLGNDLAAVIETAPRAAVRSPRRGGGTNKVVQHDVEPSDPQPTEQSTKGSSSSW